MSVVLYEVDEGLATITLNRPEKLNAWTGQMSVEYFDALERASEDPDVRVVIITGAGRGFCAGADLLALQGGDTGGPGILDDPRPMTYPLRMPKPVLAAVNGSCAGLGLVHALMVDMRFAAEGAKFTTAFSRRGLIAEHASAWLLPRLIGQANALDLLYSARVVLAEEALSMGLVNQVVPAGDLMAVTREYALELAQNCSPQALAVIKQQVFSSYEQTLQESFEEANRLMSESIARPDFREGVMSFVEKRPPRFEGFKAPIPRA